MQGHIYILKRTNGLTGIYINGKQQSNIVCNFSNNMKSEFLFDRIIQEVKKLKEKGIEASIFFTENEEEFKSELPSLKEITV